MSESKPFLRWAGSKRKLLPKLSAYWSRDFTRYVEPFMGSAVLFFKIAPSSALLSDLNFDLVEVFSVVRDQTIVLHKRLHALPLGKDEYYQIRKQDPSTLSAVDRAARFIYLNRFCFNGLYRTNNNGQFNVPYGASKAGNLPGIETLMKTANALSFAEITHKDFEETLEEVNGGDFVYLDPPYAVKNSRIFRQYGPDCFGTEDLDRLATALPKIDNCGATFLVSYALCPEALEVFDRWHIRQIRTLRSIAGFAHHRRKAVEILISNRTHPN